MRIRIKDYTFEIGEPFSSGQVISANEAVALNAVRAENIRNAVAGIVAEAMADLPPGGVMDAGRLIEVTRKIAAFDRDYQFPHRHHSTRRGRLDQRILAVATDAAMAEFRAGHISPTQSELDRRVSELVQDHKIIESARRDVEARNRLAGVALESLL